MWTSSAYQVGGSDHPLQTPVSTTGIRDKQHIQSFFPRFGTSEFHRHILHRGVWINETVMGIRFVGQADMAGDILEGYRVGQVQGVAFGQQVQQRLVAEHPDNLVVVHDGDVGVVVAVHHLDGGDNRICWGGGEDLARADGQTHQGHGIECVVEVVDLPHGLVGDDDEVVARLRPVVVGEQVAQKAAEGEVTAQALVARHLFQILHIRDIQIVEHPLFNLAVSFQKLCGLVFHHYCIINTFQNAKVHIYCKRIRFGIQEDCFFSRQFFIKKYLFVLPVF